MTAYAAPARVLTELHIPEDPAELAAACLEPVTRCGLAMNPEEMWTEVDRRPGDRVCAGCSGEPEREPGLW